MEAKSKDDCNANKIKFTSIIMNWIRLNTTNDFTNQFPSEIVQLIVNIFLYEKVRILQWNDIYKGTGVVLTDDGKCAMTPVSCNQYILANCDPIKSGIHVWRIKVESFLLLHILLHEYSIDIHRY